MITESDFAKLIQDIEQDILDLAVEYMTSYSKAGVSPRDNFTEKIMQMLEILINNPFNRTGSFTKDGALEALSKETSFVRNNFDLFIKVFHRLAELERGATSYQWIEKQWASRWRSALYKTGNRTLAASISSDLKAGAHKHRAPARPYVGKSVDVNADVLADRIDQLLVDKLPLRRV